MRDYLHKTELAVLDHMVKQDRFSATSYFKLRMNLDNRQAVQTAIAIVANERKHDVLRRSLLRKIDSQLY